MSEQTIPPVEQKPPEPTDIDRKKREAEIKARGAALKAEKDALNKQRGEILAEQKKLDEERKTLAEFNQWRSQATVDPDAFLTPVYGKDWRDTLAKATAGDTTPLAIKQLREEWEAERKKRAQEDAARADAEIKAKEAAEKAKRDADESAFTEYTQHISSAWLDERKDKYPGLHAAKLGRNIAEKVREIHRTTGEMPDEDKIAADLEAELDKLLDGVHATPKWSEKLAAKFKPSPPVRKSEQPTFEVRRKAISTDMATGSIKPPQKPMTREEKREMLARMDDNEWNKRVSAAKSLRGTAGGGSEEE